MAEHDFISLSLSRYDIRIYPTFLHLHGKTFDYKIPYTTVLRLFLLPHKDQRQMFFVVSGAFTVCKTVSDPSLGLVLEGFNLVLLYVWLSDIRPATSLLFQISLDPPIKQGQTRYHFLILLFSKEEDISLTLNMNEWVRARETENE